MPWHSWSPCNDLPKKIRMYSRPAKRKTRMTSAGRAWSTYGRVSPGENKANLRDLIAATGLVISNWIQIVNFSACVTVKFDGWPCKNIGHLSYATSSFVHHFVAIGEYKLELQSGNTQSGSNLTIFRAVRPWNLMDDLAKQLGTSSMLLQALCIISYPLVNSNLSYSPETPYLVQIRQFLEPWDL